MVVLSARFASLACLCAVLQIALPPTVKAAHLYGSHSMSKHTSSHSHHRSASPTATHGYDGGHHRNKGSNRRALELPPLLRRHLVHDHGKANDHHGGGHPDQSHHKGTRSVFARSRLRREPETHHRRSSVYLHGEQGEKYMISRAPSRHWGNVRTRPHGLRQAEDDDIDPVTGRIDIITSDGTQRLASLIVDSTPINWTSDQTSAVAFTLNASATNQTQFIMVPTDESWNEAGSGNKHVTLATEVFDPSSAEMITYCATYNPGAESALLMTPCAGTGTGTGTGQLATVVDADADSDPCAGAQNDASQHQSQIFAYDPSSGKIEPISAKANSSGSDSSNNPGCAGGMVRRDNGNSTTSSPTGPTSTSTSIAPAITTSQARNVTLVYVAGALELPPSTSNASNTVSASAGRAPVFTTTITTTVVATVTAPPSSSRTISVAQDAVSPSVPSASSQSMSTITTTPVSATATRSLTSLNLLTSSTAATSKVPVNAEESLQVEVVGVTPSMLSSSSPTSNAITSTTSTSTSATTTTSSYSSASQSLNAAAVASSLEYALVHSRRAYASASVSVLHL